METTLSGGSDPIKVCTGTHGGINQICDDCKHNMQNQPDFPGMNGAPEGTYIRLNEEICRLPMGPDRKYWTQFEVMTSDS